MTLDLNMYLDYDIETQHNPILQNLRAETTDPDHVGAYVQIYKSIPKGGDNTLLEIGPAGGYGIYKMKQFGFKVRALSIIKEDIDNLAKFDIAGDVGDMHSMPYEDASYSHVLASHVLEHSPAPYIALKEMYRVLKNPGYLVLVLPPWNAILNGIRIADYSHHLFCVPPEGVKFFIKKAGFTLCKYEDIPQFTTKMVGDTKKRVIEYHHEFYLCIKGSF